MTKRNLYYHERAPEMSIEIAKVKNRQISETSKRHVAVRRGDLLKKWRCF